MIYVAPALALTPYNQDANAGRIGYRNIANASNLSADEEDPLYPVLNLANPATYPSARWRGTTTDAQAVYIAQAGTGVDYFGIAAHNLGSTGAVIQLQGSDDGVVWDDVSLEVSPGTDFVLIAQFTPVSYAQWRLTIVPGSAPPEIGVLYVGTMLVLQRNIFVGHTPIVYGRNHTIITGKSQDGQFMGREAMREFLTSEVSLRNLTGAWFRQQLDPFFEAAVDTPFFWAWRPGSYPTEVAYCWTVGAHTMSNQSPNGLVQAGFSIQGIR